MLGSSSQPILCRMRVAASIAAARARINPSTLVLQAKPSCGGARSRKAWRSSKNRTCDSHHPPSSSPMACRAQRRLSTWHLTPLRTLERRFLSSAIIPLVSVMRRNSSQL